MTNMDKPVFVLGFDKKIRPSTELNNENHHYTKYGCLIQFEFKKNTIKYLTIGINLKKLWKRMEKLISSGVSNQSHSDILFGEIIKDPQ
jgi:hypothetical protein